MELREVDEATGDKLVHVGGLDLETSQIFWTI